MSKSYTGLMNKGESQARLMAISDGTSRSAFQMVAQKSATLISERHSLSGLENVLSTHSGTDI